MRLMRPIVGVAALVFLSVSAAQIEHIDPRWVFVSHPLKWSAPPPEIENRKEAATAGIVVFYPSGQFAEVWCTLYRVGNGRVSISRGDSHVVRVGTWSKIGDRTTVKARVVYTDGLQMGKPIPGPETILTMKLQGVDMYRVESSNPTSEFRRLPQLRDMDFLAAMIACDRSFWDGQKWVEPASLPCTAKK